NGDVQRRRTIQQVLGRQLQRQVRPCVLAHAGAIAQRGVEGGKRSSLPAVRRVGHSAPVISKQRSGEATLLPDRPDATVDLGRIEQRTGQVVSALRRRQRL